MVLGILPILAILVCVGGLTYKAWQRVQEDDALADSVRAYRIATDAVAAVDWERRLSQLGAAAAELPAQRRTDRALAELETMAGGLSATEAAAADGYLRGARQLVAAYRADESPSEQATQTVRQDRYRLSRALAEAMVTKGEPRGKSSLLRRYASLKVTKELADRLALLWQRDSKWVRESPHGEELMATLRRNLGFLTNFYGAGEKLLGESDLQHLQQRSKEEALALTQGDIELGTVSEGALLVLTQFYQPALQKRYQKMDHAIRDQLLAWSGDRYRIIGSAVLISSVLLALGVIGTMAVYQSIARPLAALTEATAKMERGDLALRLETDSNDEIAAVARGFASLNETVSKLNAEFVKLEGAADRGDTQMRGDGEGLQGEWLRLLTGMNSTLDRLDRVNRRLRDTQKMEAYAKMSGGIAHQFNNLLTVIIGEVEMQQRQDASLVEPMRPVLQASERAKALVSQLRTLGSENGVALVPTPVAETLAIWATNARGALPDKISLEVELPSEDCYVRGDPPTLRQVLSNLLANAREAIDDGGRVIIRVDQLEIASDDSRPEEWVKPGTYVRLRFQDDGHGVSPEALARVFEPFFSSKEHGEGSGLGLSMVYGFAKACGGWASMDSEEGIGTVVSLVFPSAEKPLPEEKPAASPVALGAEDDPGTVLLVEDDMLVCRLTNAMLKKLGYTVIEAHDGKEGLEALKKHHGELRLVVSDVLMPHLTGPEMIQTFRESTELPCGVLFVTGYSADELPGQIGELGERFDRLNKPFSLDGLKSKMDHLIGLAS